MPFLYSASFCAAHLFIKIVLPIISLGRSSSFRAVCFSGLLVIFPAFSHVSLFQSTLSSLSSFAKTGSLSFLTFRFTLYLLYCSLDLSVAALDFRLLLCLPSVRRFERSPMPTTLPCLYPCFPSQ